MIYRFHRISVDVARLEIIQDGEAQNEQMVTETLYALRDIAPDLPIILASGYSSQRLTSAAAEASAAGTLRKPFDVATLAGELRRVLD